MIHAGKPKFCWLSAGPDILAGCFFLGLTGSRLPGMLGTIFAGIALIPLALIVLAVVFSLIDSAIRLVR